MTGTKKLRVAVLISGSGTNLQAIIDAVAAGDLPIELIAVLSDRPDAYGLQRARAAGIPAIAIDYKSFDTRADYDRQLVSELEALEPDLVVLAGYMRILPATTVNLYPGRMLNVHPSLLPAYPGLNTFARALAAGEKQHGTTVHFVTPALDSGPGIVQYRIAIRADDTPDTLRKRVQAGEYKIYPQAIRWIAEGRVRLIGKQVVFDDQLLDGPVIVEGDAC